MRRMSHQELPKRINGFNTNLNRMKPCLEFLPIILNHTEADISAANSETMQSMIEKLTYYRDKSLEPTYF